MNNIEKLYTQKIQAIKKIDNHSRNVSKRKQNTHRNNYQPSNHLLELPLIHSQYAPRSKQPFKYLKLKNIYHKDVNLATNTRQSKLQLYNTTFNSALDLPYPQQSLKNTYRAFKQPVSNINYKQKNNYLFNLEDCKFIPSSILQSKHKDLMNLNLNSFKNKSLDLKRTNQEQQIKSARAWAQISSGMNLLPRKHQKHEKNKYEIFHRQTKIKNIIRIGKKYEDIIEIQPWNQKNNSSYSDLFDDFT